MLETIKSSRQIRGFQWTSWIHWVLKRGFRWISMTLLQPIHKKSFQWTFEIWWVRQLSDFQWIFSIPWGIKTNASQWTTLTQSDMEVGRINAFRWTSWMYWVILHEGNYNDIFVFLWKHRSNLTFLITFTISIMNQTLIALNFGLQGSQHGEWYDTWFSFQILCKTS